MVQLNNFLWDKFNEYKMPVYFIQNWNYNYQNWNIYNIPLRRTGLSGSSCEHFLPVVPLRTAKDISFQIHIYNKSIFRYKQAKKLVKSKKVFGSKLKPSKKIVRRRVKESDIAHFTSNVLNKNTRVNIPFQSISPFEIIICLGYGLGH